MTLAFFTGDGLTEDGYGEGVLWGMKGEESVTLSTWSAPHGRFLCRLAVILPSGGELGGLI
jgi:hypothetical protein